MNSNSIFIIFFANLLWMHYLFHFEFPIFFANSLSIHYVFANSLSMFSAILFWFSYLGEFNSKSPSFSRIQFKFTLNTLSVSWNHFIFIIFFANSVRIHYLFHEITLNFNVLREFKSNALFILGIRIDSTIFFANPL